MTPLHVALQDFPDIDADGKKHAERKFMTTLERCFSSTDELIECFKAFESASEGEASALSKHELGKAKQFHKAFDKARLAGFQQLGAADEAYFEVALA